MALGRTDIPVTRRINGRDTTSNTSSLLRDGLAEKHPTRTGPTPNTQGPALPARYRS